MRIILREDVASLGKSGDLVTVRDGYGRNYLLPQGMAMIATEHNVKQIEHQKKVIAARNAKLTKDAQTVADKLSSLTLKIPRQAGEGGKLFGSVSTRDIEEAATAVGVTLDRRKVVIAEPIKLVGEYTVEVKMGRGVVGRLKVVVEEAKAS
jgi:large subunit ribosomal protein L9